MTALYAAVTQLRRVTFPEPKRGDGKRGMAEYRIDDLARTAGMTTRNVRAYQDRGLLPPPRRSGRIALYDDGHLARLRLIGSMLERGYTAAHITEMLHAWESGRDLAAVMGLEQTLGGAWNDDLPVAMPAKQARALAGDKASYDRMVRLELIKKQGNQIVVQRPQLLAAFAEMRGFGMPTETVLDLYQSLQPSIDDIALKLVLAAAANIFEVKGAGWLPSDEELADLTEMLGRFRLLATRSVQQSFAASIEHTIEDVLGMYMSQLTQNLSSQG